MENINIKNIFDNNYNLTKSVISDPKKYTLNNLNINNSLIYNSHGQLSDDYLINKIKYNKNLERKKVQDLYEIKYNECLAKINNAIDINMTDIFYQITEAYFGCKLYNSIECLNFIQDKLRKKNFDTLIISNNKIFISWKNSHFFTKN
jgi:hypothetical protein